MFENHLPRVFMLNTLENITNTAGTGIGTTLDPVEVACKQNPNSKRLCCKLLSRGTNGEY